MANPVIINPTMTLAGQAAAFNAANTGIELLIDGVTFGRAHYDPAGNETALVDPIGSRVPLAGGSRPTPYQLRMSCSWKENVGQVPIAEIGFWSGDVLVFVWSDADPSVIASYKTDGVTYVLFCDLAFAQVPANSISFVVDPNESAALAALAAHEGDPYAHPQYLLRSDVAKDAGPLMGLVHAAGSSANALVLSLDAPESELTALSKFQRFQFVAAANNTGPVTVNIEGLGVKAVKRGGDTGLIELDAGDIKVGSLYDLNYDGVSFQLGGGVGSGKTFERFAFKASVAQKDFPAPHVPGSIIVLRNGREIFDYVSAADGSKITVTDPCNIDDDLVILSFKSFKVADGYTKAEVDALMKTASGMPVGAMLPVPKGVVPLGYLELDGSVKSIATYPDLAAYLGTIFNKGDEGAGNFRLPDSRGEFLRGWDHNRGVDAGRAVGSWQKASAHTIDTGSSVATVADRNTATLAATALANMGYDAVSTADYPSAEYTVSTANTSAAVLNNDQLAFGATRPRNLAVMWCIKAWNAPVNQGQIDVAALAAELEKMKSAVPVGALMPFPAGVVPPGYVEADGSLFLDALYPDLATYLNKQYNIAGDAANSTRLPETRGEFLRGWDHGRGVDAGRGLGSYQLDALQNITGNWSAFQATSVGQSHSGAFRGTGSYSFPQPTGTVVNGPVSVNFDASLVARTSTETRPRNLAVMWCIKAWNTPVNQGTIDVGVLAVELRPGRMIGTRRIRATQVYWSTPGTRKIRVKGQGAGAAGGGAASTAGGQVSAGCGGSAGAPFDTWITDGFDGVTVTIGKGGTGVLVAQGNNGGATSFGSFVTAPGGIGGGLSANVAPPLYLGQTPNSQPAVGATVKNGTGKGGGGVIGPKTDFVVSGEGGASEMGAGGNSISNSSPGADAVNPGSGGGGAVALPSYPAHLRGGNGADGWVDIEEWT
ncbi:phage tail protein [Pseudomonas lurida]|uniref:phage tail protein n=1 Tax=Pseudomonas lurida TaxID=244566 RepID=UPI00177FBE79|nr:phage tail protein [Pseudomonas lurida]MBD8671619.1 tail fiber protein [Pseudomonas lurida]